MEATLRDDFRAPLLTLRSFVRLESEESEIIRSWRNDERTRRWLYQNSEIDALEHARFMRTLQSTTTKGYWLAFKADSPLGVVSLTQFSSAHKRAYLGIYTDPNRQGEGLGKGLMEALIWLAFEQFSLHALRLEVLEANTPALRLYEGLGFVREGILRDYLLRDRVYHDVIIMSLINPKSPDLGSDSRTGIAQTSGI